MPELNEKDLRKLFQTAGHGTPARDLTDRIMARVAVTPILRLDLAKPLISMRAWLLLGMGFIGLAAALMLFPSNPDQATGPASTLYLNVKEAISQIHLPKGSWLIWSAIAAGSMLLFNSIDGTLMRSMRRSAS